MSHPDDPSLHNDTLSLGLFLSPEHACGYLSEQKSSTLFVDPYHKINPTTYEELLERGFRRSGHHVYRPFCVGCDACLSARLPVNRFQETRSLKRVWRRNRDLKVIERLPIFRMDHFNLYKKYIGSRHAGGPMDNPDYNDFLDFLACAWSETRFYEFRREERLVMVAVVDHQPKSLSAVYTFFDPDEAKWSPGIMGILWQIGACRSLEKEWLYLGYWIPHCQKMAYKERFRPLEVYRNKSWNTLEPGENAMERFPPEVLMQRLDPKAP
ncbi:MAG: arginyltransferase [Magnetococcales bacterium]|nr:arginyltransferase [Magnetococcales bacterium]